MHQITEQDIAALEEHHGPDMIVVLSVGDDDFAFRRPADNEVSYALESQANDQPNFLEELTLGCLLTPAAPRAGAAAQVVDGKMQERYAGLAAEEMAALVAEKGRLEALWEGAQSFRDEISMQFGWACGSQPQLDVKMQGAGLYAVTVTPNGSAAEMGIDWAPIELVVRKPERAAYDRYKRLEMAGAEGDAERYIWGALVESANKADVARRFPFAVIAVGRFLPTLGTDGRSVRLKKFGAGPASKPGGFTNEQAARGTSA